MSSPASDRPARGTSGPYSVLRKEDLPGVGTLGPSDTRHRDPARQTGPRRKADADQDSSSFDVDSHLIMPSHDDPPEGALPPARPKALSIPYATLPPKGASMPPNGVLEFTDESGVTRPSGFPPQAPLPRGISRTPSAPSRGYLSRATCREHGLALSNQGTCMRCVKERAQGRSRTLTRALLVLMFVAVGIGCAIVASLQH